VSKIPFLEPRPARLSTLINELKAIEASGIFTNYGPVNSKLEQALVIELFGHGGCLTVNNATAGLMLAIRDAVGKGPTSGQRYALMPSFTFAATAHAAIWAGLRPLLCDIDAETWVARADAEEELLKRYRDQVAVVVPYATFGNCIDLDRYDRLARDYDVPVVVDAAASLGSLDEAARSFGTGSRWPIVYSMHATKTFATAEGGVIYCNDAERLDRLRSMGNFGFGEPRTATMPGLNSKLSEIGALLALAKLGEFEGIVAHRASLADAYRENLPDWVFQRVVGQRLAYQFMPVLLPKAAHGWRDTIVDELIRNGVGVAKYFSPHLAEQPYFKETCVIGDLTTTNHVSQQILSLPLFDRMSTTEVAQVCKILVKALRER
jgi:dTDP-4-amino-4,6-dideoxygalactose transaminase